MLKLNLLRHAKSSWQAPDLDDHERDLNDRGRRDAPRMGYALAERLEPQPVHCSSALRARRTLEGICEAWPQLSVQAHVEDDALYTFDWEDLLAWLQSFGGGSRNCFVIGHNPALTNLCNQLVGRPALDTLPTAGFLALSLPVDEWSDVTEGIATLDDWLFPRDLPA